MKFLIWICCLLPAALLITIIERSGGIILGPLPKTLIAGVAATIAIFICGKRKENINAKEVEIESSGERDNNEGDEKYFIRDSQLLEIKKILDNGECPCCFRKIEKTDDNCWYCDYNLAEQRRKIDDCIKRKVDCIKREEEKREKLIESVQAKISTGANFVMIYFRPVTPEYRYAEIELYKDNNFLAKYKVEKNKYFKSIEKIAFGDYEFILKQFDKKKQLIVKTEKIPFCFN